jgi:hypothetical protein
VPFAVNSALARLPRIRDQDEESLKRIRDCEVPMSNGTTATRPSLTEKMQAHGHARTLAELIKEQGVHPLTNPEMLHGTWPGDLADGFEAAVEELRRATDQRSGPQS